ncbi:MAG: GIY-YIG nuclease family protein [Syntrophomonas sp.]|nr:GIY-YIG nuclease family protein [Syntrophomonas sp.]
MPYVYILKCSDNTLYTGYTVDIKRRLQEHQEGLGSKYTRGRTPVELVYLETQANKSEAMQRECQLKKLTKAAKQRLIENSPIQPAVIMSPAKDL